MDALSSWSTGEQLAIASLAARLGDNDWLEADAFFEPFCEVGKPADWINATACAREMKSMLSHNVVEPECDADTFDDVLKRLTEARISELEGLVAKESEEYAKIRDEMLAVESGQLDHKLDELLEAIGENTGRGARRSKPKEFRPVNKCSRNCYAHYNESTEDAVNTSGNGSAVSGKGQGQEDSVAKSRNVISSHDTDSRKLFASLSCESDGPYPPSNPDEEWHTALENCDTKIKLDHSIVGQAAKISLPTNGETNVGIAGTSSESHAALSPKLLDSSLPFVSANSSAVASNMSFQQNAEVSKIIAEMTESAASMSDDTNDLSQASCTSDENTKMRKSRKPIKLKSKADIERANYRAWKKSTMILWKQIASHRYASLFMHPVTDDIAPNYSSMVYRPVDLSSIKHAIEDGTMRTTGEFQRDLMLMFQNALMYNDEEHPVHRSASIMQSEVMDDVAQFWATQIMSESNLTDDGPNIARNAEGASEIGASKNALLSVLVRETKTKRGVANDARKKHA